MSDEKQILPSYRSDKTDKMITNWDYDEEGKQGQKKYIRCWLFILSLYSLLFYGIYYFYYMEKEMISLNSLINIYKEGFKARYYIMQVFS